MCFYLFSKEVVTIKIGLPDRIEAITEYERTALIWSVVNNLWIKLVEEFAVGSFVLYL